MAHFEISITLLETELGYPKRQGQDKIAYIITPRLYTNTQLLDLNSRACYGTLASSMYGNGDSPTPLEPRKFDDGVTVLLQSVVGCFPVLTSKLVQCH